MISSSSLSAAADDKVRRESRASFSANPPSRTSTGISATGTGNGSTTTTTTTTAAAISTGTSAGTAQASSTSRPRRRHPQLAVLLGVDKRWYIPLQIGRGLSTSPAAWWGLRCFLTFATDLMREVDERGGLWDVERRFRFTEMLLAVIWCFASGYLSFFFTDCLMSRWLVNYTPQATLVRLFTVNCANAYLTSWVLFLSGGYEDPRLLLPAWISIASILTVCYHVTQRKINIRRETSASLSVFSLASSISMISLILQLQLTRPEMPTVPLFIYGEKVLTTLTKLALRFVGPVGRDL